MIGKGIIDPDPALMSAGQHGTLLKHQAVAKLSAFSFSLKEELYNKISIFLKKKSAF